MNQLNASEMYKERTFWVVTGFLVVAPLSCFQSLDALKYTSTLSITFIMFLTVIIVLFTFPTSTGLDPCKDNVSVLGCRGHKDYLLFDLGTLRVLSVFVFGYTCQQVLRFRLL
jgi:amino acid permease